MKKILLFLLLPAAAFSQKNNSYTTPYEKGNGNQTATYNEAMAFYRLLDAAFETIQLQEMGTTDAGVPLHIVIFDTSKHFNFNEIHKTKAVLLINNGIHPGEPDGIDATMMLLRDLATGKLKAPENTVVVAIPVYNIGGMLNRGSYSRANQNGPESYGFRGNSRNYDLNRDFIKADTREARSFAGIFHTVQPDMFIDTHVSNGADYQYTLTYIATHHQRLGGALGEFFKAEMMPAIVGALKAKGIEATPYVNIHGDTPETGFEQFMDYGRYSTGYASLFNVPGSMPETHMLKEYSKRVAATYEYIVESLDYLNTNYKTVKDLRANNLAEYKAGNRYTLDWQIDSTKVTLFPFLGYTAGYKPSNVTGESRLYYDRTNPFNKVIKYYQYYIPAKEVVMPEAYIIPQEWWPVAELLKINNIQLQVLDKDTDLEVESYHISSYKTSSYPYEGHYPHRDTDVMASTAKLHFRKGDYVVSTAQPGVKYLLETLEPQGVDSFFNWNFFDAILQQKEYYSAYVFEDTATRLLQENKQLRAEFDNKKLTDKAFASDAVAQLDWIYTHSPYYEKSHMRYPVYRRMPKQ